MDLLPFNFSHNFFHRSFIQFVLSGHALQFDDNILTPSFTNKTSIFFHIYTQCCTTEETTFVITARRVKSLVFIELEKKEWFLWYISEMANNNLNMVHHLDIISINSMRKLTYASFIAYTLLTWLLAHVLFHLLSSTHSLQRLLLPIHLS